MNHTALRASSDVESLVMSIFQKTDSVKNVSTHRQNREQRDDDQTEAQKIQLQIKIQNCLAW
jgi:hypothetical protein